MALSAVLRCGQKIGRGRLIIHLLGQAKDGFDEDLSQQSTYGVGVDLPEVPQKLEIGKGRIVREGGKVAILSLGARLEEARKAADQLDAKGLSTTIADLRFAKPLDTELIDSGDKKQVFIEDVLELIDQFIESGEGEPPEPPGNSALRRIHEKLATFTKRTS